MGTHVAHVQEGLAEVPPVADPKNTQTSAEKPNGGDPPPAKKTYRWQPTDAEGNALGGIQVVEYADEQELADKMRDINVSLQRELRKFKRENESLRPPDTSALPQDLERLPEPKPLTDAERLQLTKDLLDPAKMEGAHRRLNEATGESATDRHTRVQREAAEANIWAANHAEYYDCAENNRELVKWHRQRKLLITQASLDIAYRQLRDAGLLLEAPMTAEATRVETPPAADPPESRIAQPENQPPSRRPERPSSGGLTRSQMSSGGGPTPARGLTWADVDRMPAAEWEKKYKTDPNFKKQFDALPPRK